MSLPRMSLHIGDYRKDTGHLRAAEHGAYLMLIMHYWAKGGLPDDDRQLATIACMTDREWKKSRPIIAAFFGPDWSHGRIDEELRIAKDKYERRVNAGSKGGIAKAAAKQCSSNATPMPQALTKQPITLTDKEVEVGGGDDARELLILPEAVKLADEIAVIIGYDLKFIPPAWCGAAMTVTKWLREGWSREAILIGVRGAMARKRDGPPDSINYFEKAIARLIAQQKTPLPVVKVPAGETINGAENGTHRNGGQPYSRTSYQGSRDAWRHAAAELERSVAEDQENEGDGGLDVSPSTTS